MEYSELDHLVIITGHYEGIDERLAHYVNEEVSIGDFILTGGEIAAAGISDSTVRLLPDVLKERQATEEESFFEKDIDFLIENLGQQYELIKLKQKNIEKVMLIEYPQYTRPEEFEGCQVPEVLLSGNHAEIEKWRLKKAYEETKKRRPDLLE
jgi:tRNA (guanine37-N1)-methyltransferase